MTGFLIAPFKKSMPLSTRNNEKTYLTLARDKIIYTPEE